MNALRLKHMKWDQIHACTLCGEQVVTVRGRRPKHWAKRNGELLCMDCKPRKSKSKLKLKYKQLELF